MVAHEHGPAVVDLGRDHAPGQFKTFARIVHSPVLGHAELHVLVHHALGNAVEPAAGGKERERYAPHAHLLHGLDRDIDVAEQGHVRGLEDARLSDLLLPVLHLEDLAALADTGALFLDIKRQGVVPGRHDPPDAVSLRPDPACEHIRLVGQADAGKGAPEALGTVHQGLRDGPATGHGHEARHRLPGRLDQFVIEGHVHPGLGLGIVDVAALTGIAVGPQDKTLAAELHPVRLPRALGIVGHGTALVVHRRHAHAVALHQVDARAQVLGRRRQPYGAGMYGFAVCRLFGQVALLLVHPAVPEAALGHIDVDREVRLHPLDIGQSRAVDVLVHHPCRHDVEIVMVHAFHANRLNSAIACSLIT